MLKAIALKKSEMVDIYLYSSAYKEHPSHNKDIKYCINFAKKKLEPDATALLETYNSTEEYNKYENAKKAVVEEYADKDENNNSIEIQSGVFKINKDVVEVVKSKIEALDEQYKDDIKARQADLIELEKKLDEVITIELEVLEYDKIPDNVDDELMKVLFPIIIKE